MAESECDRNSTNVRCRRRARAVRHRVELAAAVRIPKSAYTSATCAIIDTTDVLVGSPFERVCVFVCLCFVSIAKDQGQ